MAPSVVPCAIIELISLIRKLTRPRAARRPRHAKLIEAFAAGEYPSSSIPLRECGSTVRSSICAPQTQSVEMTSSRLLPCGS